MVRSAAIRIKDLARPSFSPRARLFLAALAVRAPRGPLEPGQLMDAAIQMASAGHGCRLDDFGDERFCEPLEVLCRSLSAQTALTRYGRALARRQFVHLLVQRLRLQDLLRRHPEIHDVQIRRPIIIVGMPRTGTTHLNNLLSSDPALRHLPLWESISPFPAHGEGPAAAIERTTQEVRFIHMVPPHLTRMIDVAPTYSHEDAQLLSLSFASGLLENYAPMPSYREWYLGTDQRFAYEYLRTTLKALTWLRGGRRWLLKSPQHLNHLPALKAVFPDATVVFTHRDPVKATVSALTMACYVMRCTLNPIDPPVVGRYWKQRADGLLEQAVRNRDLFPASQSIDVPFHDFVADNLATAERIYHTAGQAFTPEVQSALQTYTAEHAPGRHGRIDYRLSDFALNPTEIRTSTAAYRQRFDIQDEPVR